jgi:hypothetical protein
MTDYESVFRPCIFKNHNAGRTKKKKRWKKLNSETENDNTLTITQQAAGGDGKEKWKQKIKQQGWDTNKWEEGRVRKSKRETREEGRARGKGDHEHAIHHTFETRQLIYVRFYYPVVKINSVYEKQEGRP